MLNIPFQQWVIIYLCAAALVAGGSLAFAAWSRGSELSTPAIAVGPALLAGALWPLVVAGLVQWLLAHGLAQALRRTPAGTGEALFDGPPPADPVNRPKVGVG